MAESSSLAMTAEAEAEDFEFAVKVAQIFSAVTFTLVAIWMSFTNTTSLAYVQRASMEKRLTVCCFINTYVGMFSAFFNYFQLTEVDNLIMPENNNYTIDLARPIEWILTCPLMQLILVILGGAKIPEERRLLMPFLSFAVLCLGLLSTYINGQWRFVFYGFGCIVALLMFALNAKQIVEHSDGLESFLNGDSEYRKATLLVILLWFPFPLWYIVSPEGLGWFDDPLLIQVGWAFLNIVAKFSFIFYVQRVKDAYCTKLKAKREMYQPKGKNKELKGDLTAVVIETLNFLGMAQNSDRILNLFGKANIYTTKDLAALTQEQCREKMLPADIVLAVQKRLRVWLLEMTDNAEQDIEVGEGHYHKQEKTMDDDEETCSDFDGKSLLPCTPLESRPQSANSSVRFKRNSEQAIARLQDQHEAANSKLDSLMVKLNGMQVLQGHSDVVTGSSLLGKIEVLVDNAANRTERSLESVGTTLRHDLECLGHNAACIAEEVAKTSKSQEATMADMRRQHMMLMELVTTDRENVNARIMEINSSLNYRMPDSEKLAEAVRDEVQKAFSSNDGM